MENLISPLAYVHPSARLGKGVQIGPFAYVEEDVEIGANTVIKPYASILNGTKLGARNTVHSYAMVGVKSQSFRPQDLETTIDIGNDNTIREYSVLTKGLTKETPTLVGDHNFFMSGSHVGHDSIIGDHVVVGIDSIISGRCHVGNYAILSTGVTLFAGVRVGCFSVISGGARLREHVPPFISTTANPTKFYSVNHPMLEKHQFSDKTIQHIEHAYEIIFRNKMDLSDYIQRVSSEVPEDDNVDLILDFLRVVQERNEKII